MTLGAGAKVFDPSDDPFYTVVGDRIEGSYLPVGSTPVSTTVGSGPGSVVAVTTGGITINLLFDTAAMAAPASFRAGIQQAAAILASTVSDHITVNLKIDYSGTGGGAAAGPDGGLFESYTAIRSGLINNATPGDTIFSALPSGSSIQGQSSVAVWNAELKVLGLLAANDTTTDDGSATFATDINPSLLVGVALHELSHALGRVPYGPQPDILDLFRFTSSGVRLFQGGATAPAAYFSVDGGVTKLADLGRNSDASDFLNSGVQGSNDPFNEFYNGSTSQNLSATDKIMLDALGFHVTAPVTTTVIEALGSTKLDQVGNNFSFDPVSGGSGPVLKYDGAAMTAGQWGAWTPIGVEAISGGYEVAWKVTGANTYTVWNTDSNGNITTDTIGTVSGSSIALETLETSFHQDLNGDGVIGIVATTTTVIEALGSTKLDQVGSNFSFDPVSGGSGPVLKYDGAAMTAGQWGAWTPIGAEATSGGYEVAWKVTGTNTYTVWNTDSNGNITTNTIGSVSGSSTALEALETSFHQDLNGDGVIGIVATTTTVIEALGSTKLDQVGNNFSFDPVSGGSGPVLKYDGVAMTSGQWGGWTPIGVEATSGGYEVAWKVTGASTYTVWNTDSSGNITSNTIGTVAGNNAGLESLELSFQQDLNGDGVIGVPIPTAPGPAAQTPAVTITGNDSFVFGNGGAGSPGGGNAGTAGQFGSPIAAAQLAALFHEAPAAQPQTLVQPVNDAHDTVINSGDHFGQMIADLHASAVFIH